MVLLAQMGSFIEQLGLKTKRLNFEWGSGVDIDLVDKELSSGKYDVFAMVHNETSTGAMSNLDEMSNLLRINILI